MEKVKFHLIIITLLYFSYVPAQSNYVNLEEVTQTPVLDICENKDLHNSNCFKSTLQNYIASRLKLPYDSLNRPIEGNVKAYLIFNKEGNLIIKAIRSKNKILQTQSKNIFDDFPKFKPASINDSIVSMALVFPLQYSFSTKTNQYYSIKEVNPPQIKNYKKKKTEKELWSLYHDTLTRFIIQSGYKHHDVKSNFKMILLSFEIDSLGNTGHFHDLIERNPKKENTLNKLAIRKLLFKVPPKIHGIPVQVRDTIEIIGIERKSLGYSTRVVKGYPKVN